MFLGPSVRPSLLPPPPHPIIAGRENGNQLHGGGVAAATGCETDDIIGVNDRDTFFSNLKKNQQRKVFRDALKSRQLGLSECFALLLD